MTSAGRTCHKVGIHVATRRPVTLIGLSLIWIGVVAGYLLERFA